MFIEVICYALSGFFMKTSDDLLDEFDYKYLSIIAGLLCVLFTIYLCLFDSDATCIFLSIIIGVGLASKLDNITHIISTVCFIILLLLFGNTQINWMLLIICILANFLDEKGNDYIDKKIEKKDKLKIWDYLLKYRYVLKITVLVFSLLGLLKSFYPQILGSMTFFKPETIIYFYLFDLSYEFAGYLFNRLDNVL